jgi:HSP20 family molecular chaperone IbpA
MRIDILDDSESAKITCLVEIPGLKKQDVSVHVQDGHLIISGVRRPPSANRDPVEDSQDRNSYVVKEVRYGRFRREVPLPSDIQVNFPFCFTLWTSLTAT